MAAGLVRKGFDVDLREGGIREDAFANMLFRAKCEHKRDHKWAKSGFVFLEYKQHGRPSGIATTEADWWVFEIRVDLRIILPTDTLRKIGSYVYRTMPERHKLGGDYDGFAGVLLTVEELLMDVDTIPFLIECLIESRAAAKGNRPPST